MSRNLHYTSVLSIAGSDSSGGAGIQADIKTCQTLGVYAMTAITAVTAQNTCGVKSFVSISESDIEAQIEAVVTDIRPDAVKIGMVPTPGAARVIADCIERYSLGNVVLDPVMVATSGDTLSCNEVMQIFRERLFPRVSLLTPNLPEARALSGIDIADDADLCRAVIPVAEAIGCGSLLLKGGHSASDKITDVLLHDGRVHSFTHPKIDTRNTHGTGCTLSSAIASYLAKGHDVPTACACAIEWLSCAIERGSGYEIGRGHGPVCHFTPEPN